MDIFDKNKLTLGNKRILITGINGFVGTNLYEYFNPLNNITGIDISIDKEKHNCLTYSWNDLSDLPDVDAIIHLAGIAHDTNKAIDESKYYEINVGLTAKIFDHYLNSSAQKFIFFSSVKAVADSVKGASLLENVEPNPQTAYGKSKLEAEKYILSKPLPKDKFVYILRPAMIHGPGNKGNLNQLFSILKYGIPYPLGAYKNERSFTSIQNLLFILERLLELEVETGSYNVCDDESLSTSEIARVINQALGNSDKIWNIPKVFIETLARIGDFIHLPLNSERLKKMTESYIVSNEKIKNVLTIKSLPVTSQDGMSKTIKYFKE